MQDWSICFVSFGQDKMLSQSGMNAADCRCIFLWPFRAAESAEDWHSHGRTAPPIPQELSDDHAY